MIAGFIIGVIFTALIVSTLNTCKHEKTIYVEQCRDCGKTFCNPFDRLNEVGK